MNISNYYKMTGLSDFQIFDPSNNLVYPWLTHPALDVIKTWDLSDMLVLEWGSGLSTLWWADKCKYVMSIEANQQWFADVVHRKNELGLQEKAEIHFRNVHEGDQTKIDFYTEVPAWFQPNIVVVDGILRYECILKALELPRPLTLIVDNWQQDRIFICPAAEKALEGFTGNVYVQPDHTDHEGRPWATAIFNIK
jgi:hypothetical protein